MFGGRGSAQEQREQRAGQVIGKSSESVQCAMLSACDACADMGQL